MKILIVGGGIAGATLAAFLQRNKKFKITLVDQASKFGNIGFAIALWGNGRHILNELGLAKSLIEKKAYEIPWDVAEDTRGKILKTVNFDIFRAFGPTVIVARSDLHGALTSLLKGIDIRFGTKIKQIHNSEKMVTVEFNNGVKENFDLLIGADGTHSQTRDMVFGPNYIKYAGWRVWSFWVPSSFAHPAGAFDIFGDGKVYFVYPLFERAVVLFGIARPPKTETTNMSPIEDLHQAFQGFKPSVHEMINSITDPNIFNDDINYVEMDQWYKNRVVLIGDAQHAVSPVTGMGASLALEDAFVLAEELNHATSNSLTSTLQRFSVRRTPRIEKIKKASKRIDAWSFAPGIMAKARDVAVPFVPAGYFLNSIRDLLKEKI